MLSWLSVVLVLVAAPRRGVTCLAAAGECLAIGGHGGVEVVPVLDGHFSARDAKEKRFVLGEKHNTFALALSGDIVLDAQGAHARFAAIPSFTYSIERSTNAIDWTPLQSVTAPESGLIEFLDPAPPVGPVYYRTAIP